MSPPSDASARSQRRFRLARLAVLFGGFEKGVGALAALVRVPLLIWGLDLYQYGLYMAILGVVATGQLLDFGLHFGVLNAVAEARGRDDRAAVARIVATAFWIYGAISLAAACVLLPLLAAAPMDWLLGIPAEQVPLARSAALIAFAGFLLPLPLKVFAAGLYGFQQHYAVAAVRSGSHVVQLGALALAVWLVPRQLLVVVAVGLAVELLAWGVQAWLALRVQPELRFRSSQASRALAPALAGVGLFFLVTNLANLFKFTLGSTVVSHGLGPAAVPAFSVPLALFMTAHGLAALASDSLWPAYGEAGARGEWAWVRRAFGLGAKAGLGLSAGLAALGALYGDVLIDVWTPKDVGTPGALLGLLALWLLSQTAIHAASALLNGLGRVRVVMGAALLEGAAVFATSVLLVERLGVLGVGLGMALSGVVAAALLHGWLVPRFTDGRVRAPWGVFARVGLCLALAAATGAGLRLLLHEAPPWLALGAGAGVTAGVHAAAVWGILLDAEERRRVSGWLRDRGSRRGSPRDASPGRTR